MQLQGKTREYSYSLKILGKMSIHRLLWRLSVFPEIFSKYMMIVFPDNFTFVFFYQIPGLLYLFPVCYEIEEYF